MANMVNMANMANMAKYGIIQIWQNLIIIYMMCEFDVYFICVDFYV